MSLKLYVFESLYNPETGQKLTLKGILNQCSFTTYKEMLNNAGDFKLKLAFTDSNRNLCKPDYIIWLESDVCGLIERVLFEPSQGTITVLGRMMSCMLARRALKEELDYTEDPKSVGQVLSDAYNSATEDIPLPLEEVNIPNSLGSTYDKPVSALNLLDLFQSLCAPDDLGFRVSFDSSLLTFRLDLFQGKNRTVGNPAGYDPVVFSQDNDTVTSATYEQNIKDQPNTAIVVGEEDVRIIVYKNNTHRTEHSTQEVYLDYSSEPKGSLSDTEYRQKLTEKAQEYFKSQKDENTYDAKVNSNTYQYVFDYFLGDFVTAWDNVLDVKSTQQITQVSKSFDSSGEKIEPILGIPQKDLVSILQDLRKKTNQKKEEAVAQECKPYYTGPGLSRRDEDDYFVIELNSANRNEIGGIRLSPYVDVPADDTTDDREQGIYKAEDSFPAIRKATSQQIGGLYVGDGLAPRYDENTSGDSTTYSRPGQIDVRIGEGLEFVENEENPEEKIEELKNKYGGRAIAVTKATKEKFGMVKLGNRIGIDADGSIYSVMSGKDGIEVSDKGEISVLIDDDTIRIDGNGKLYAQGGGNGVSIENAVIISEADSKYILHTFTETEYIEGNRIGYAGVSNQIITQGYIAYNEATIAIGSFSSLPDIQMYSDIIFEKPVFLAYNASSVHSIKRIYLRFKQAYTTYNQYELVYVTTEGTEIIAQTVNAYFQYVESFVGLSLAWRNIYSPGYTTPNGNQFCEFGCAYCIIKIITTYNSSATSTTRYQVGNISSMVYAPYIQFDSEAEFNAAVGLTYTPGTIIEVRETLSGV